MKKFPVYLFLILFSISILAGENRPLLHRDALPLIFSSEFSEPLDESFSIAKGKWTPVDGELVVLNLPEEKHIPVLHHKVGLESAVIEVEFFMERPGSFLVGCDSAEHVGRVVINAKGMSIAEDSVKPSHTIATLKHEVKTGQWHQLRVEWKGDEMAASLNGEELRAQHAYLTKAKARSWLAAGDGLRVRHLKISGVKTGP